MCRIDVGIPKGLTASERFKRVRYYIGLTEDEYEQLSSTFHGGFIFCFAHDYKGRLYSKKMFFSQMEYAAWCALSTCLVGELKLLG